MVPSNESTILKSSRISGDTSSFSPIQTDSHKIKMFQITNPNRQYNSDLQHKPNVGQIFSFPELTEVVDRLDSIEHSFKSIPHSRDNERRSGLSESPRDKRGLPDRPQDISQSLSEMEILPKDRPICKSIKLPDKKIRKRSPPVENERGGERRKRISPGVENEQSIIASSNSSDYEDPVEIRERKYRKRGIINSSRLAGTNMVSVTKSIINKKDHFRTSSKSAITGAQDEEKRIFLAPRLYSFIPNSEISSSNSFATEGREIQNAAAINTILRMMSDTDINKKDRGKLFFISLMRLMDFSPKRIKAQLIECNASSTMQSYFSAWNYFFDFLVSEGTYENGFDNRVEIQKTFDDFIFWISDEDEPICPKGSVRLVRSAVSFALESIFQYSPTDAKSAKNLMKTFRLKNPLGRKYLKTWDAGILLDFYRVDKPPAMEIVPSYYFNWVQQKTAALLMLFTLLRPSELHRLEYTSLSYDRQPGGIILQVKIKSHSGNSLILIPKLMEETICPYTILTELTRLNGIAKKFDNNRVFVDWDSGINISFYKIKSHLDDVLEKIGVDKFGSTYSFKHSAISYLIKRGVKISEIREAALYKNSQDVITKNYAPFECSIKLQLILQKAFKSQTDISIKVN
jgi:site-specific recombinase XerD